jgi:hypothetical protein
MIVLEFTKVGFTVNQLKSVIKKLRKLDWKWVKAKLPDFHHLDHIPVEIDSENSSSSSDSSSSQSSEVSEDL